LAKAKCLEMAITGMHANCQYQTAPATSAIGANVLNSRINDLIKRLLSKNVEMLLFLHTI